MEARRVKIKFHNKRETLTIVDVGGDLVNYLANEDTICPLIGSEIKFLEKLGEGAQGAAFLIKLPDTGTKTYVAKKLSMFNQCEISPRNIYLKHIARTWSRKYNMDYEALIKFNGGNPNRILMKGESVCVTDYAVMCRVDKSYSIDKFDGSGKVTIPEDSYICQQEQYSEYVIGAIAGNIYRNGKSVNFFDVFMFSTCSEEFDPYKKLSNQYIFMEKIDGIMRDVPRHILMDKNKKELFDDYDINYDDIDSIYVILLIQTLHALACLQKYKIVHGDLHLGNIFVEYVTEETKFSGKKVSGNNYYAYEIGDTTLYLPAIPILAKIGDYGLSVKWSKPLVGNKKTIDNGYDQRDGFGPWIPNWYARNYDVIYLIRRTLVWVPNNTAIRKIYAWILGSNETSADIKNKEDVYLLQNGSLRPNLKYLNDPVLKKATPRNILTNKNLLGKFMKKPKGNIITLGSVN